MSEKERKTKNFSGRRKETGKERKTMKEIKLITTAIFLKDLEKIGVDLRGVGISIGYQELRNWGCLVLVPSPRELLKTYITERTVVLTRDWSPSGQGETVRGAVFPCPVTWNTAIKEMRNTHSCSAQVQRSVFNKTR